MKDSVLARLSTTLSEDLGHAVTITCRKVKSPKGNYKAVDFRLPTLGVEASLDSREVRDAALGSAEGIANLLDVLLPLVLEAEASLPAPAAEPTESARVQYVADKAAKPRRRRRRTVIDLRSTEEAPSPKPYVMVTSGPTESDSRITERTAGAEAVVYSLPKATDSPAYRLGEVTVRRVEPTWEASPHMAYVEAMTTKWSAPIEAGISAYFEDAYGV